MPPSAKASGAVRTRKLVFHSHDKGSTRTTSNDSLEKSWPASRWRRCTMRAAAQPPKPVATTNK